jgi:epoxyqueuosine reductase
MDQYTPLRQALQKIALRLRADGHRAVVFADENDLVDREVAYRAGLGWFGRNANLLLPGGGSFFSIGSVVTTAPLPTASRPVPDGCGSCRQCIDDCPTGAIVADGVIDARRCLAWLVQKPGIFPFEFRVALGDRIYGCDACQTGCPPNIRLADRYSPRSAAGISAEVGPGAAVDLLSILDDDDSELLRRFGAWYLADRDPVWLRRNALVILANVAPVPVDDRVRAVLSRYLSSDSSVLRAHAVWASRRLGCDDLVTNFLDLSSARDEISGAAAEDPVLVELRRPASEVGRRS